MSLERALGILGGLGLDRFEAEAYFFLTKEGPHRIEEIGDALRMDKKRLYRSLKILEHKGFVTSKTINHTIFIAVPFEKIIEDMIETKSREKQRIEQTKQDLLSKHD